MTFKRKSGGLLAAALFLAGFAVTNGAIAQTASNVVCKKCVHTRDLADDAVTSNKIRDKSIKPRDLHKTAKPAGVGSGLAYDPAPLDDTYQAILSIDVDAPGPGVIVATADFVVDYNQKFGSFVCAVTRGTTTGNNNVSGKGDAVVPVSSTQPFIVPQAGKVTIKLVCWEHFGEVSIGNRFLTALFVPGQY